MNKLIGFIFILLSSVVTTHAAILFEENFDDTPDWQPSSTVGGCSLLSCPEQPPVGWDYFRNDEYWVPSNTTGAQPSIRISSDNAYGGTGKSLTCTNESESDSPNGGGGGWSSDGVLSKVFANDYNELCVEFKIKFKTPYYRIWNEANASSVKTFRIIHWDREGSIYDYFTDGYTNPALIVNTGQNSYHTCSALSVRCDPQETNYYCDEIYVARGDWVDSNGTTITAWGDSVDSTQSGIYDGEWHTIRVRGVLNSSAGTKDGIYEFWQDGHKTAELTDVSWVGTGGDITAGWNSIEFGGNSYNNWLGITNGVYQDGAEQWYAIDDIKVGTSMADLDGTPPTYAQPTIAVSDTNTGTSSSGTITGTYTIDSELSAGLCTWSHSSGSVTGFATVLLGVVSGTVTGLPVGATTVSFSLLDSEDQEATDTAVFMRSPVSIKAVVHSTTVIKNATIH